MSNTATPTAALVDESSVNMALRQQIRRYTDRIVPGTGDCHESINEVNIPGPEIYARVTRKGDVLLPAMFCAVGSDTVMRMVGAEFAIGSLTADLIYST